MRLTPAILVAFSFSLLLAECAWAQVPGTTRWILPLLSGRSSSPAVAEDGTVYVAAGGSTETSANGGLYSVSPQGTTNWILGLPQFISSSPAISQDGRIILGCGNGQVKWVTPTGEYLATGTSGRIPGAAALTAGGTVYIGSVSNFLNKLYALNPDGSVKWIFSMGRVPSPVLYEQFSSPAIGPDGTIYVGSLDKNLYAIHPNGTTNWVFPFVNPTNPSPATAAATYASPAIGADGTIYIGAENKFFYAITPHGFRKWAFATQNFIESTAAIDVDGTVYFGSGDGHFYALTPDGKLKWSYATGGVSASPAIAADGTVYVASYSQGSLYAFDSSGSNVWTFTVPGSGVPFASPTIGPDGTVYLAVGATLYAVYGTSPAMNSVWPMFRRNMTHSARSTQIGIATPYVLQDGTFGMGVNVETGRTYQVQYSENLREWAHLTNFISETFTNQVLDVTATNSPQRFYRLGTSSP